MTAVHRLTPEPTNDPSLQLYRIREGRQVVSELRIKAAPGRAAVRQACHAIA